VLLVIDTVFLLLEFVSHLRLIHFSAQYTKLHCSNSVAGHIRRKWRHFNLLLKRDERSQNDKRKLWFIKWSEARVERERPHVGVNRNDNSRLHKNGATTRGTIVQLSTYWVILYSQLHEKRCPQNPDFFILQGIWRLCTSFLSHDYVTTVQQCISFFLRSPVMLTTPKILWNFFSLLRREFQDGDFK